jgi:hypothetical protein
VLRCARRRRRGLDRLGPAGDRAATTVRRISAGPPSRGGPATADTTQQIGGSISTALLNTLAASAATIHAAHHLTDPLVQADATLHSNATAYWWSAGFFAFGALVTVLLFRRKRASQSVAADTGPADALPRTLRPPRTPPRPGQPPRHAGAIDLALRRMTYPGRLLRRSW